MAAQEATVRDFAALIGGEPMMAKDGRTIDSVNPATGELIGRFPRYGAAEADLAIEAAIDASAGWETTSPAERAACLLRFAEVIDARADELALLDVRDNGSPFREMRRDAATGADRIRFFVGLASRVRGETISTGHERLNYTLREPYGVVVRIVAFNHPLMFFAARLAPPLLTGNTVIMKPSEFTSLSALALVDDLAKIFPPGVVNVVTGYGHEVGDALVTHPETRRISLIGGAETGRKIAQRAATHTIKTLTLELGGKNPLVVFPDADQELAIDGAVRGMNFTWQGQSCGSTSRVLIQRDQHDEFVARLANRIAQLNPGMPEDEGSDTGALVNKQQLEKVLRYVQLGQDEGAQLVTGGTRVSDGELEKGFFVRPAVFADVDPTSQLAQDEIFGPVLAVIKYDDYDDALRIANGVRYGLTASVFTRDLATAHRFARDVKAGYVWVNDSSSHFSGAPFGGVKASGIGRDADLEELESYTQTKNVNVRFA